MDCPEKQCPACISYRQLRLTLLLFTFPESASHLICNQTRSIHVLHRHKQTQDANNATVTSLNMSEDVHFKIVAANLTYKLNYETKY